MMDVSDIPVWLINLDRATERRIQMEARLKEIGLKYQRFSAVDGRAQAASLEQTVDRRAFECSVGRTLLPGEIGATHSHIAVWKEIANSGAEFGLVLEDDVVFHAEFNAALAAAIATKDQWDFLKLNKIRAKIPLPQARISEWTLNAYAGPCTGFGAYLIKADLAKRLIKSMLPIRRPIDRELDRIHVHKFRHLGLEPFPSHVDDGNVSTITGRNSESVKKFKIYRRLPDYGSRLETSFCKFIWLVQSGQIRKWIDFR